MIEQPWRLVAVAMFLGALAGGIVVAMRPQPVTKHPQPTTIGAAPTTGTTATAAVSDDLKSTTSRASATTVPSPATTLPPPADVAATELEQTAVAALNAWGVFAVTGNIAVVADLFDPAGPQYGTVLEEAAALAAEPIGLPGYTFTMGAISLDRPRQQRVVLTGPVTMTRPGEADQQFVWRIHLRWSGTEWRLWTIDEG